jgi:succinyl-diaminopimelate desuccinylase
MFDQDQFLADLKTFVGFRTCVETNPDDFARARAWIKAFFDPEKTAFIELEYEGFVNLIIKPADSLRPNVLGDGHIEVVPGDDKLFVLREESSLLYGRGVADMKTQCLMMMVVLRQLIAEGNHNDFWILFSEDEEIGSPNGAKQVISYLCGHSMQPHIVFVPDGGHDFAFVEKEKGKLRFTVTMPGVAAHASRPFLGENAIEKMMAFYRELQGRFPNPRNEADWVNSVAITSIAAG